MSMGLWPILHWIRAATSAKEVRIVLSCLSVLQIDICLAGGHLSDKYLKSISSKS